MPGRFRPFASLYAFRATAANRSLLLVQGARLASVTGRWAYSVTLAVYAYRSGGATGVAIAAVVRLAPAALAAPLTSAFLARRRMSAVLLEGGVLRAAALAGAAVLVGLHGATWTVYCCVAVEAAVSAVLRPVQQSLLPHLARTPGELTQANLSLSVIESAGVLVGPLCGAFLLHASSLATVFAAAAGTYAVSAALLALVPTPAVTAKRGGANDRGVARDAFAAFAGVIRSRDVRVVVALYGAQSIVAGTLNVLIVVTALRLLHLGQSGVGTLTAALGLGGIVGGVVILARLRHGRHASDLALGLVLWGIPLILLSLASSEIVALVLLGIVGVGVTVVDVASVTLLQRAARGQQLADALGLLQATLVTSVALGTVLAPVLVSALGVRGALVTAGIPLPVVAGALWRRLRELDDSGPAVSPERLALVAADPIFAPLPEASQERLAADFAPVAVQRDERVFAQGDEGDAFYLIEDGTVAIEIDGAFVRNLQRGDSFGEIALLRAVPRTATARAVTDATLLRLERDDFLGVVTGERSSADAANAVASARLGLATL
jgi:hypothetical protein